MSIDREALVRRHAIVRSGIDFRNPIQVGNGRFAFNADITGLQSFVPFACLSDWGWHSFPEPANLAEYLGRAWDFHGREVVVPDTDPDHDDLSHWLDDNPHRLNLGRIGLRLRHADGADAVAGDLHDCRQELDLWTGILRSHIELADSWADIVTCCHPDIDVVAVDIESPLLDSGQLAVFLDFPAGDGRYFARHVGDWTSPRRHTTELRRITENRVNLLRRVDRTEYRVGVAWEGAARLREPVAHEVRALRIIGARYGEHDVTDAVKSRQRTDTLAFTVDGELLGRHPREPEEIADLTLRYEVGRESKSISLPYGAECRLGDDVFRHRYELYGNGRLAFTVSFNGPDELLTVAHTQTASSTAWPEFWNSGGAIDLSETADPRAAELERRIVLSQYVMAVNERGANPPQETGLVNNSWHGKFHFEMYFWHAAHWALWDRWPILRRSLRIYPDLLESARERAREQGFVGARWPKCTGPAGRESPGEIHALLVWQQPHVHFFAELDYAAHPTEETLRWWAPIVGETAEFLASYVVRHGGRYVLGPPVHIVSENTDPAATTNPAFELAYWRFGLETAQHWRERLGQRRNSRWDEVLEDLSPLPVQDIYYVLYEGVRDMWQRYTFEHPAITGMYGWLPGSGVDPDTMRRTAERIFAEWQLDRVWGWDFPMLAMCAARLGKPETAIDFLTYDSDRFRFTETGLPTGGPFPYLPSSGSLLYAAAMLAAGWEGADKPAPGFPADWTVRYEGLHRAL